MIVRSLFVLILAIGLNVPAAGQSGEYRGRTVASVIDEFRSLGYPFAYSTNLVNETLTVLTEPEPGDPVAVVRQILAPHDLVLRSEEGYWLVVRRTPAASTGALLIIARDRRGLQAVNDLRIRSLSELPAATHVAPGILQVDAVPVGAYRLEIGAPGFAAAVREVGIVAGETTHVVVELGREKREIENITVSASRYEILRDISTSRFNIDQDAIETLPDIGEDPLRAAHRLPGAAASGTSARAHFRGGDEAETGIILNGNRLFDPFHIRDYQNVFSAIDARAIDGVEVYTGGFPVQYGDRLSGVVLMESLESTRERHTEVGLSVFNTSVLSAGTLSGGKADWLFSARRGNLDLVIDPKFGEPSYYDVFSEVSMWLTPNARLSVNGLYADDSVVVVLETEPDEREQATSRTRNAQFWLTLENLWSDTLTSRTVLSFSAFNNRRDGFTGDFEKVVSDVSDTRDIEQFGFRQDWTWHSNDRHLLQWGFNLQQKDAHYDYVANAEFFGLNAIYRDVPTTISRDLSANPNGASYALYFSDRWRFRPRTVFEFGLRWDDQTHTELSSDGQLSPRLSVLHGIGRNTELRLSWGRYYQSQDIHELQIEDGVTRFFPAQRADHTIVGVHHRLSERYSLRAELFRKEMRKLRPRFENLFNPLAIIPELQADRVRLAPSSASAKGIELSLNREGKPLSWWASYSLSDVADTIMGDEQARAWDQRHSLQLGLNWKNEAWDFSVAAHVRSGWPTTSLRLEEVPVAGGGTETVAIPGPRNAERLSSFASLDARLSRTFDVRRGKLTAFVEIANLLNRDNVCCIDYDLGEDAAGNDILEFSKDFWLPLLPAAGILWEF